MKCCGGPGGLGAAYFESEVAQDVRAGLSVAYFGMKLHRPHLALRRFNGGDRAGGAGHQVEAGGKLYRFIAVRHPDRKLSGQALKQTRAVLDFDVGVSILALVGGANFSAQGVHHELKPVTDAEHGYAQFEHAWVRGRRVGVIHRGRAAGKNDADRGIAANFFQAGGAGEHHRKDVLFADAARDELGILRAKVEDDDGLGFHGRVSQIGGACKGAFETSVSISTRFVLGCQTVEGLGLMATVG